MINYEDALEKLNIREWKITKFCYNIEDFKEHFYKLVDGVYTKDETLYNFNYQEIEDTYQQLLSEEPMRLLRLERDARIAKTDWRATVDYPGTDQEVWLTYRQALRDLPATAEPELDENGMLTNVTWPEEPA